MVGVKVGVGLGVGAAVCDADGRGGFLPYLTAVVVDRDWLRYRGGGSGRGAPRP